MVYAKIVRESENSTNVEVLPANNNGNVNLYISGNSYGICKGFLLTQEDLKRLYEEKKRKSDLEEKARETEEERKKKEELEEIRKWKEEKAMEERKWYRNIIRFFKS